MCLERNQERKHSVFFHNVSYFLSVHEFFSFGMWNSANSHHSDWNKYLIQCSASCCPDSSNINKKSISSFHVLYVNFLKEKYRELQITTQDASPTSATPNICAEAKFQISFQLVDYRVQRILCSFRNSLEQNLVSDFSSVNLEERTIQALSAIFLIKESLHTLSKF